MNDIIKVKPEWKNIYRLHASKVGDIQGVVWGLISSGLKVTFGDIENLLNNGTALYEQAQQAAKSNASIFSLPAAKRKFIDENTQLLQDSVLNSKRQLTQILALESLNTLSIGAFEITKGVVSISESWIEELKESHTIRNSENREKAQELMNNVKEAVTELNDFVKNNQYFGAGVSTFQDDRRSLVWFDGTGEINLDINNLEFVE